MPIVEWGSEYLLGIQEFDEHHEHLVGLLNRTYDEYTRDPSAGNLEGILKELVDYAAYHFESEERWMNEHSYPKLSQQKAEHDKFAENIAAFQKESLTGQATSSALFIFLADWLTSHILDLDADYGRFYASKGGGVNQIV